MESALLDSTSEAGFNKPHGAKEKKSRRAVHHSREVLGAAATKSAESSLESRQRAPEAHQLHGAQKPEHIGHVLMTAESQPERRAEQLKLPDYKSIETLNRPELLELSEAIVIDGSSLRQIYETHLIGERGLRRLIAEHMHGGDLKRVLRQEITEREIDFERDPAMRDIGSISVSSTVSSLNASQPALDQLLERAAASLPAANANEGSAFYKARANYEAEQLKQQLRRRRLTDIGLTATVAVLIMASIIIYLVRH